MGKLVKAYPICYAHTKLMEARTHKLWFPIFKSYTPINQLSPKICTIKVCMYLCYKTHIPQTLKLNEIKINKHSNTALCTPTRWSYTHSSVPNFVDHCSRGDVVKSGIWANQNRGLVQNLLEWVLFFMKFRIPCVWDVIPASTANTSAHSWFIIFK